VHSRGSPEDVVEQCEAGDPVEHFRDVRFHSRPFACRKDHDVSVWHRRVCVTR
jgi:hypothetical protein